MAYQIEIVERPEQTAAVVRGHADPAHIGEFIGRAFDDVAAVVAQEHLAYAGPPFGRYRFAEEGGFDVEAGFPVTGPATPKANVEIVALPGGSAARTVHVGPYGTVAAAYEATAAWVTQHGYVPAGPPWEAYLDEPDVANPRTEVYFPVRPA